MKKQWIIFWLSFSPTFMLIFGIVGYFSILDNQNFVMLGIALWVFNSVFCPILHFGAVCSFVKTKLISMVTAIISILSYFACIAISYSFMAAMIKGTMSFYSRLLISEMITGMVWSGICLVLIAGNMALTRLKRTSLPFKMFLTVEAVLVLICMALFPIFLEYINILFEMHDFNYILWLYLKSFVMISLFSCLLGLLMTKRAGIIKLALWLLGILVSVSGFMLLCENSDVIKVMTEHPESIPSLLPVLGTLLVLASAIPFTGCLLCFLLKKDTLEKKGFVTD